MYYCLLLLFTIASKIDKDLHEYIDENPPAWKLAKQKAQKEGLDK